LYSEKSKDFSLEKCLFFYVNEPVCWICVGGGAGGRRAGGLLTKESLHSLIYYKNPIGKIFYFKKSLYVCIDFLSIQLKSFTCSKTLELKARGFFI